MTDSHDTTVASAIPRRGFLRQLCALPLVGGSIALANTADPYPALCAAYYSTGEACNADGISDEVAERWANENTRICKQLIATRATTFTGALAGMRIALAEYQENHWNFLGEGPCLGDKLLVALMESAIGVLEGKTANV